MIGCPKLFVMSIEKIAAVSIDNLKILTLADAQTSRFNPTIDLARPADQDRPGNTFVAHDLNRSQYSFVLPFCKDDSLGRQPGLRENRLHDHAGVVDKFVQPLKVSIPVLYRTSSHTGIHARLCHSRDNFDD